jgi:hypothetical protein
MEPKLFGQRAISLFLGLLIGQQRERADRTIGGIRTYPLIAAFGTLCGWLAVEYGGGGSWRRGTSRSRPCSSSLMWQRSTGFRSHFCRRCGSTVPNLLRDTDYVWVPAGAIDDPGPLEIVAQIFLRLKTDWNRPRRDGLQHETSPSMAELIAILHGQGPEAR